MTKLKVMRTVAAASSGLVLSLGVVGMASAHSSWSHGNANSFKSSVKNNNHIEVTNDNDQSATRGNAKVNHNNNSGDAKTGGAANENSTSAAVTVSNPADPASPPADLNDPTQD